MNTWNRLKLSVIIAGIGIGLILLIFLLKPKPSPDDDALSEPEKTEVLVKQAHTEELTLSVLSQGTVNAKRNIDLVAQVSGTITQAHSSFHDGALFEANEVLVTIDQRDYEAALLNARALHAQAERGFAEERSKSRQAKREWRELGDKASNDLFLRKPQLAESEAQLASAKASLETAKRNLERTQIIAPFNGRIVDTKVDLGQFVSVGTPIAKVYDTRIAEIRIPLTDRQLAKLDLPYGAISYTDKQLPQVSLQGTIAGQALTWNGRITRTEGAVDINSRMYYAIAEVANAFTHGNGQSPMIPGLFVNAEITGKTRKDIIKIPASALVKRQFIYTLNEVDAVELTPVNVLRKHGGEAWISADIAETTRIVLEKHALLSVGTIVKPIEKAFNPSTHTISPDEALTASIVSRSKTLD